MIMIHHHLMGCVAVEASAGLPLLMLVD